MNRLLATSHLGYFIEHLTHPVDMVADGSAFLFRIIQKVNRIEQTQVVYFAENAKQLV